MLPNTLYVPVKLVYSIPPTFCDTCFHKSWTGILEIAAKNFLKAKRDNLCLKLINTKGTNPAHSFQFNAGIKPLILTFCTKEKQLEYTSKMFVFEITLKCIL